MIKKLTFLFLILYSLFFTPFQVVHAAISEWGDCVTPEGVPTLKCLEVVFGNIIFMSTGLIILALFIMFIIGAFQFLTSLGNPERIKKAQGTLKFALLGFILFMSAFLILKTIDVLFLGGAGKIFKFEIGGP